MGRALTGSKERDGRFKGIGKGKVRGWGRGRKERGKEKSDANGKECPGLGRSEGKRSEKFQGGRKELPRVEMKGPTHLYSDPLSTARWRGRMLMCR